jgi:hypothetical protein
MKQTDVRDRRPRCRGGPVCCCGISEGNQTSLDSTVTSR